MPQPEKKQEARENPEALALFQDRLLQLLWEESDPARIRGDLLAEPALAEFRDYIEAMEDRMIGVAAELVRKWGSGKPEAGPGNQG